MNSDKPNESNETPAKRHKETVVAVLCGCAIALVIIVGLRGGLSSADPIAHDESVKGASVSVGVDGAQMCGVAGDGANANLVGSSSNACVVPRKPLQDADNEVAKIAWKYFENNYNTETGLVNAVNNFKSTTMWDTGSALAATIAARDFGLIDKKDFDDRIVALLKTLATMKLFNGEAPNKVYNTKSMLMVDYGNKPVDGGIGVSTLDLARLMSWLNTLSCMHPKYHSAVTKVLSRWKYGRLIKHGLMYGLARDKKDKKRIRVLQEGRLGYEQYAAKIFERFGFNLRVAASYENEFRGDTEILGVSIAHDLRTPEEYHANNYVVTESYTMDAMELGLDAENTGLLRNIFDVQKRRWENTGTVTAVSEDNINQKPWFLYNTIFNAGKAWQTTNSSDVIYDELKSVSTKAAVTMAILYPDEDYSGVLASAIESAYDPDKGWYSGIYESGAGYNTVVTANTNGVILSALLFKKYGALFPMCEKCSRPIVLDSKLLKRQKNQVVAKAQ